MTQAAPSKSRRRRKGGGWPAYALYVVFARIVLLLPHRWVLRFGAPLGRWGWRLDFRHRRVAEENVARALPELDAEAKRQLVRACFEHFGRAVLHTVSTTRFDGPEYLADFRVEGVEHLESVEAAGRGLLMISAHLGVWEAAAQWLALTGRPCGVVYRPLDNRWLDREVKAQRERFGNTSIPKRSVAREGLRLLRRAGRLGILMDQRVQPREGDPHPFFDRPAHTSPLPAQLSLRTGVPVLPLFALRDEDGATRIVIRPPIAPAEAEGREDPVGWLTRRYLGALEDEIRRRPEQWLWMHRRWRVNPSAAPRGRALRRAARRSEDEPVPRRAEAP